MTPILGFNSAFTTQDKKELNNGYLLYDWTVLNNGSPAFWGRHISGGFRLTVKEADFLHEKGCKIFLIFDWLDEEGVSSDYGYDDAMRAITAAHELGVPQNAGIAIFAKIRDDWKVNYKWMLDYANALKKNGYIPGFIGNTDSLNNPCFNQQSIKLIHALSSEGNNNIVFWATKPRVDGEVVDWLPSHPSGLSPHYISLWTKSDIFYQHTMVFKTYARDESVLRLAW